MKTRVITGVTLIALLAVLVALGGWWLRGAILLL